MDKVQKAHSKLTFAHEVGMKTVSFSYLSVILSNEKLHKNLHINAKVHIIIPKAILRTP